MARAGTKVLEWNPSPSTDVTTYWVRASDESVPITYDTEHVDVGLVTSADLGQLANDGYAPLVNADGKYNLGVSAIDDLGNESDIAVKPAVPLDFVPPEAPTDLRVR